MEADSSQWYPVRQSIQTEIEEIPFKHQKKTFFVMIVNKHWKREMPPEMPSRLSNSVIL